jgi:creatinine amidohydrolase
MIHKNNAILWDDLSWKDIQKLTQGMKMVIIPIGACEQHGPHLPLSVDTIDCYEVAKRVSAKTRVPVIPPLTYGCSQSHGNFPGTLSLRPETMIRMICDIVEWLYRSGIRKILLLNVVYRSGIGDQFIQQGKTYIMIFQMSKLECWIGGLRNQT